MLIMLKGRTSPLSVEKPPTARLAF